MRTCRLAFIILATLCLASCGSKKEKPKPAETPAATAAPAAPAAPSSEMALPISQPMASRNYLLDKMSKQKAQARDRERQMEEVMGTGR